MSHMVSYGVPSRTLGPTSKAFGFSKNVDVLYPEMASFIGKMDVFDIGQPSKKGVARWDS